MALRLTIVNAHGAKLATDSVKEFGPGGGTIGRSLECDWVLPDSKRYLSSRHASIDFRSGSYYIVDTSMNGVYVNDADHPVGRGTPQRLFDGDRLRIGEYEISVEIDEDPIAPLMQENHIDPVDLAQRVEAPEPHEGDMVDAYEITGVGIEMMLTDDELETLSPPPRSKGAYFEIVDDDPAPGARPARAQDSPAASPASSSAATLEPGAGIEAGIEVIELGDATQPAMLASSRPGAGTAASRSPTRQPAAAPRPGVPAAGPATRAPNADAAAPASPPSPAARQRPAASAPTPPAAAQSPAAAGSPKAQTGAPAQPTKTAPVSAEKVLAAKPAAGKNVSAQAPAPATRRVPPPATDAAPAASTASPQARTAPSAQPTPLHARAPDLGPFFRGARISASVPPQQVDAFLFRLGQVVRATIEGVTESLHLCAEQKSALRLPSPAVEPEDENPLKQSAGLQDALVGLLFNDSDASLPPVDAVREAFDELQQHQQLVLKALRAALDAFISRLDPEELEHKFARGRSNMLVNAANRLKYWDLYKDLYDVVAHHPPGELPLQFQEDFAQAYERELEQTGGSSEPVAERQAG